MSGKYGIINVVKLEVLSKDINSNILFYNNVLMYCEYYENADFVGLKCHHRCLMHALHCIQFKILCKIKYKSAP